MITAFGKKNNIYHYAYCSLKRDIFHKSVTKLTHNGPEIE
ncbi:hypothetical protein YPPY66_3969 [Yersinia pestis PY-66]|uniref:Uncharacterized protein n=3 Tax=Yersinia pseudotuberculosis complex TaxID=1649845 RepID=A0A0U1R3B9_YERP3|nr:hypothetical protein YpsIP31758_3137 [Yersinia pseudotuberculosis IP 31758]ABX86562.1 hypothetical protein YpAngola_A3287 [Yersinia pestis Angola]ADV99961.1 hypothetical protein YPC_3492 [Yersinia pestis biovar Medievalis str. Harbin 35]ANW15149.1 hypothetical protein BAY22_14785 [Yersinia pestis]EDR34705.1 hypothetical protein YPIP275_3662 [Yersinia pestis biovar Orientalis str. IP275]EDR38780.1 hypothetical protein YpF1991016_3189 [Yersinia pestis biovar Orientalis str. F1991016]EDR42374